MNDTRVASHAFGPVAPGHFDFTLLFEQTILSILPSSLFIVFGSLRLYGLARRRVRVYGKLLRGLKTTAFATYATLQLAILIWVSLRSRPQAAAIAAALLSLLAASMACGLSYLEHARSLRPSTIITSYLVFTVIFDAVQVRTLWLLSSYSVLAKLSSAALALKIAVLVFEAQQKRSLFINPSDRRRTPEDTSGAVAQSLMQWLVKLFARGYRHVLAPADLYELPQTLSTSLLVERVNATRAAHPHRSFAWCLLWTFKYQLLAPVIPRLFLAAFTLLQPVALFVLLSYLEQPRESVNKDYGYGLIGAFALIFVGQAASTAFYWHQHFRFITAVRGAIVAVLYSSCINKRGLDPKADRAVTLMSVDMQRIVEGFDSMHEIWSNCIVVGFGTWLLGGQVGAACFVPLVFDLFVAGLTTWLSSYMPSQQKGWMSKVEYRTSATANALSSLKALRMTGLQQWIYQHISSLRALEIGAAKKFRVLTTVVISVAQAPKYVTPIITLAAFLGFNPANKPLDAPRLFTVISLLMIINAPLNRVLQALPNLLAGLGCLSRINEYLDGSPVHSEDPLIGSSDAAHEAPSEIELRTLRASRESQVYPSVHTPCFELQDVTLGYETSQPVLRNVSLKIETAKVTLISGHTSSGKSTLCNALLGEIIPLNGNIATANHGQVISYCSQQPFFINDTVRNNILAGSPFYQAWYDTVLVATAVDIIIATLDDGDQSLVGSSGMKLSGGERQRIALARAIYARNSTLFLDDIFTGLDPNTERHIASTLFGPSGLLRVSQSTVVIFTSRPSRLLPLVDCVAVIDEGGRLQSTVGRAESANARNDIMRMLPNEDHAAADPKAGASEVHEGPVQPRDQATQLPAGVTTVSAPTTGATAGAARKSAGTYRFYLAAVGVKHGILAAAIPTALAASVSAATIWLSRWSDSISPDENRNGFYLGVYSVILTSSIVFIGLFCLQWMANGAVRGSIGLHSSLLRAVVTAPLDRFSTVDRGEMLSRFSQDLELIDSELPFAVLNTGAEATATVAQAILIAIGSPFVAVGYPLLFGVFYLLQDFYLRTSRQLRQMDLDANGPLYTHFLETAAGLTTIHAFQWGRRWTENCQNLIEASQRPFHLLNMIQQWLEVATNYVAAVLTVIVVTIATQLHSSASLSGVALISLVSFSQAVQFLITNWVKLETSIGAVSRIKAFSELMQGGKVAQDQWHPSQSGTVLDSRSVQFSRVRASYWTPLGTKTVLRDINLNIKHGQKWGICGRSGSGKSTLLACLLRLIDPDEGSICIGGTDIATLAADRVRQQINAVPQDTFVLSGTIRRNLDPPGLHDDATLESVLRKVELWTAVDNMGGLGSVMTSTSFSPGQLQLFGLGRALLRRRDILVLDEVSSIVDEETDKTMQRVIREEFAQSTIIAVAHRLDTILDFDRIVMLHNGEVVEVDEPARLLARDSAFARLYYSQQEA